MNRGLIERAFRETWGTTLLLGLTLMVIETGLAYVLPKFAAQLAEQWTRIKLLQGVFKAMVGADIAGGIGPEIFAAIPWVHPLVLAVVWAHAIVFCTRVPAGEVDRGTADVLYALPVSRWGMHASETAAWVLSAATVLVLGVCGYGLGSTFAGVEWRPGRVGIVVLNLFLLYAAVGGVAWLASALGDRRGRAMSAAFVVVVVSFLLNYLSQFWEPLQRLVFLSLLRYYRPLPVIAEGAWPLKDMMVLALLAIAMWIAAGVVSSRRDLSTT